ncbi:MAG: hypothetical protein DMF70_03685 [Acidobacteria bacterium]|nr:MAG: hypothetical protein DMF70_03685 [Acidobacteriota bacterium]
MRRAHWEVGQEGGKSAISIIHEQARADSSKLVLIVQIWRFQGGFKELTGNTFSESIDFAVTIPRLEY